MKKHNMFNLCIVIVLLTAFCSGCGPVIRQEFTPVNPNYKHSNRTPEEIELFMEGNKPGKPFIGVGTLEARYFEPYPGKGSMDDKAVQLMREKASKAGLDGVYNIHYAPTGTVGAGTYTGTGFVYINK